MYSKKSKNKKNKIIIIIVLLLVALAMLFVALEKTGVTNLFTLGNETAQEPTADVNTIDYGPPTEAEVEAGDTQKDKIIAKEDQKPANEASVVIVDASQYDDIVEVRAFVSNIIEDGTCTYVFTKENSRIEKTSPAYGDASTTPCVTLTVPRSEFENSGTWNVTVTYTDTVNTITGSTSQDVEIQ